MYSIAYKTMEEIGEEYGQDVIPHEEESYYECVLTQGNVRIARFIKLDIPRIGIKNQITLQTPIRCYIIPADSHVNWSKILERYR